MEGLERRNKMIKDLEKNTTPISGGKFSKLYDVSRQVIVQDIALLRASGYEIISTNRGYVLNKVNKQEEVKQRIFHVEHSEENLEDELKSIIHHGGKIVDVFIKHEVYGQILVELQLETLKEVENFLIKLKNKKSTPLYKLTNGEHFHTIEAKNESILDEIEIELKTKGYLIKE